MAPPPLLSVVIACYDEEQVIEPSFREIRSTLVDFGRPFEVLFVDDGSRDRTRELLARVLEQNRDLELRLILHERNQGRGATVSDGFRASRGAIVGYLDVDLEVHCRYIPSLVRAIQDGADVASVRRIYAFQLRSLDRYPMSRGYAFLVRHLLGVALHDTETGFKFFRREPLLELLGSVRDPGWFWDTEIMVRAAQRGLGIREIPGAYVRRFDKRSTVHGLRDSLTYLRKLLAFRAQLRRERA